MATAGIYFHAGDETKAVFLGDDTPALRIETKGGGTILLSFNRADREGVKMLRDIFNDVFAEARSRYLEEMTNWKKDAANAE